MRRQVRVLAVLAGTLVFLPAPGGVAARAQDAPGGPLVVSAAGDGQFATIEAALRAAGPDAVIQVRPGTYRDSLAVDRPVVVEGSGKPEEVILECEEVPCLVSSGKGVVFRKVTFRCRARVEGGSGAAVVATGGDLLLESCGIAPGSWTAVEARGKETVATLRRTTVGEPREVGVWAREDARIVLEKCSLTGGNHAAALADDGEINLRETDLAGERGSGLVITGKGRATVDGGEIRGFAHSGISVKAGALTARRCTIRGSGEAGVFVFAEGRATLEDAEVRESGSFEVLAKDRSQVTLKKCRVRAGKMHGLVGESESRITAEDSEFVGCARSGAGSRSGAVVQLRKSALAENAQTGAWLEKEGTLALEDCRVEENGLSGIDAKDESRLSVTRSKFRGNKQYGIVVRKGVTGSVTRCDLTGNGMGGLWKEAGAELKASGNRE